MNDVILQGIMLILTGFAGFIVKTVKDYLFKEGGEKSFSALLKSWQKMLLTQWSRLQMRTLKANKN